jgi:hypothetical protein
VPRKSKIDIEKQTNGQAAEPGKAKRKKPVSRRKTVSVNTPVGSGAKLSPIATYEPSDDEIRIRAYFIAERRIRLSLEGNSDQDWLEAKRQLVEEADRSAF